MASAGIPRRISVSARARWIQLVVATPLIVGVLMGRPAGWMVALTGRSPMKSPGAPSLRREIQRAFWRKIARGAHERGGGIGGWGVAGGWQPVVSGGWWDADCRSRPAQRPLFVVCRARGDRDPQRAGQRGAGD